MRAFVVADYAYPSKIALTENAPPPKLALGQVLVDVTVQHEREDGRHGVHRRVPRHEPALVQADGREVEDRGEHGLHDGNDQPAVDDELRELGRAAVRVAAVPEEELREEAELRDGEVGGEGRLFALLADDTNACAM